MFPKTYKVKPLLIDPFELEEKKARGKVHIAIGDNIFYGRDVRSPVHRDMVIYQSTVIMDGYKVVDQGRLLFDD